MFFRKNSFMAEKEAKNPSTTKLQLFEQAATAIKQDEGQLSEWWKFSIRRNDLIDYPSPHTGLTLLHTSAYWNKLDAVKFLLDEGSAVDKPDLLGHTALWLAAYKDNPEIIHILLDRGASPHKRSLLFSLDCLQIAQRRGNKRSEEALQATGLKKYNNTNTKRIQFDRELMQKQIEELTHKRTLADVELDLPILQPVRTPPPAESEKDIIMKEEKENQQQQDEIAWVNYVSIVKDENGLPFT